MVKLLLNCSLEIAEDYFERTPALPGLNKEAFLKVFHEEGRPLLQLEVPTSKEGAMKAVFDAARVDCSLDVRDLPKSLIDEIKKKNGEFSSVKDSIELNNRVDKRRFNYEALATTKSIISDVKVQSIGVSQQH